MKLYLILLLSMFSTNAFCVNFYFCVSKDIATGRSISTLPFWDVTEFGDQANVYSQMRDPDLTNYPNYILYRTNKMNDSHFIQFEAENKKLKTSFTKLIFGEKESSVLIVNSETFLCVKE